MAIVSLFFTGVPLESFYFSTDVPVLGHLSFGTSTIFDIGVYLVVIGLALDILRSLGSEIDRQSDTPGGLGDGTGGTGGSLDNESSAKDATLGSSEAIGPDVDDSHSTPTEPDSGQGRPTWEVTR